jgi:uncharacterized integral membrane protein
MLKKMKTFPDYILQGSKIMVLLVVFLLLVNVSHAQLNSPGGENDAPIDGGLSLLVAAGVGYGAKKLKEKRKKKEQIF